MKSQIFTALFTFLTFSGHAFAAHCDLILLQRGVDAQAQPQLERIERKLSKANINANLFSYHNFEVEVSKVKIPADTDRACFELAVAKAGEMEDSTVHIEVTELSALGIEDRFIDASSHPVVRWRFVDGWELFNPRGTVSKNALTCDRTSETSFQGERVYAENCQNM